jgi:OOP family OmpA-OmpF porin
MKRTSFVTSVVVALTWSAWGIAHAQGLSYNPSWYVSPSIIVLDPDNRFGTDKTGYGLGLKFGKPISDAFDVQMGITSARSRSGPNSYQQTTLGVDGLYMFSRSTVRPFVLLGIGAEQDRVRTLLRNTTSTAPYLNAGLGVQFALNDQWSAQIDLRRVYGFLRNGDFPFNRSNNNVLAFGLNYAFDKPAAVATRVAAAPTPAPVVMAPVAPPAPVPQPAPAPRFEKYTLSATELFAFDSAVLRGPQPKLDEIAAALNANKQAGNLVITGYTDRLGSAAYNQKLSERRAMAVMTYLADHGTDASRLKAVGKGEANPVVTCSNKKRVDLIACLEPNRRVEIDQITLERRVQ